jgi:opacity protein-like surface antigen
MKLTHSIASLSLAIAFAASGPPHAQAHHGQDFMLLADWHLPAPGVGYLTTNFDWEKYSDRDEFGLAPSLMIGVAPRVALSLEADFRDESDDWRYNSVIPAAHFQITGPESKLPFRVALNVGYQFVDGAGAASGEDHHEPTDEHGAEHGAEHAEATESHSHSSSVHNHDSDALMGRLIIEGDFGDTKAIFNLIAMAGEGDGANWGYAAGVRQKVVEKVALGIEALGDFDSHGWHELVGGVYYEPVHSVTVKLGAGFGLTEETPDFTLRTGFIWRF